MYSKVFHFAFNRHDMDLLNTLGYFVDPYLSLAQSWFFLSVSTLLMWRRLYRIYIVLINA